MKRVLSRTWPVATWIALFLIGSPSLAGVNLLANSGFEDGGGSYNGWFTFGAGVQLSLPAGDDIIRTGVAASKLFGEFTNCPGAPQFDVGGYGQFFTPTAGQVYEFSGYSYVASTDPMPGMDVCNGNRAVAKIAFFDAAVGGFEISVNEILIADWTTTTDQWNSFTVSAPAPAGAMRVEALILFLQPGCDQGTVYLDDLSFCELPPPPPKDNLLVNPSFDVDLSGWTTFGNVFYEFQAFGIRTPPGAAKVFSTFVPGSDSGLFQSFPATPGSEWKLDVWAFTTCEGGDAIYGANDNLAKAKIVFRDGVGTEVGSAEEVVLDNTSPLGTWTPYTVVAAAPAGTVTAEAFLLFVSPSLLGGAAFFDDIGFQQTQITDVTPGPGPLTFELHQNVPNPFHPSTRIDFALERRDVVDVAVYDVAGRRVATLWQGPIEPGTHSVTWNGRTANGTRVAAGVYRYVLKTSDGVTSRSMMLLR